MAPIILNLNQQKVEVTSINYSNREIRYVFHFEGTQEELMGFPPEAFCSIQSNAAGIYLTKEGFLPTKENSPGNWNTFAGVIVHNNL